MGEVYRARDTRLNRIVAIKVVRDTLASASGSPDRFEREIHAISRLTHPHICALYDVGRDQGVAFFTMQYLEGETLAQRLARGPLGTADSLRYGIHIADALDCAHRQGIVHRDLKPGNVMLTPTGAVLLDFGLARLDPSAPLGGGGTHTATHLPELTAYGTILGTLQYMAPEQLEGKPVDACTDIFAFGAVMYEMLAGRPAFASTSQASLIGAILRDEPVALGVAHPLVPPMLDHLIRVCLAKQPSERWQSARDLSRQLRFIADQGSQSSAALVTPTAATGAARQRLGWPLAALIALAVAAALSLAAFYGLRETPPAASAVRFMLQPPDKNAFVQTRPGGENPQFALSPNGRRIVFAAAEPGGPPYLWLRELESLQATRLDTTAGAAAPFWSGDGRSVAYFADGKLKRVEARIDAPPPQVVCDALEGPSGAWSRDDLIIFSSYAQVGLLQVAAGGGTPAPLTTLDRAQKQIHHLSPQFLPDRRHFLFSAQGDEKSGGTFFGTLGSKSTTRLIPEEGAVYVDPGYLLFMREGRVMAQRFDAKSLTLAGEPALLLRGESSDELGYAISASQSGVVAYSGPPIIDSAMTWYTRAGVESGTVAANGRVQWPVLSPDGQRVAYGELTNRLRWDLWVADLARGGIPMRFSSDATQTAAPAWSPDGSRLAYSGTREGVLDMFMRHAAGATAEELLLRSAEGKFPTDWSADGTVLIYDQVSTATAFDIYALPLTGERIPRPLAQTSATEFQGQLSPNGRWLAYASTESSPGMRSDVFVQTFAGAPNKWRLSTAGGWQPRWRRDGKELFFIEDETVMAVDIRESASGIEAGRPRALFKARVFFDSDSYRTQYSVTPDGLRFLINTVRSDPKPSPIVVLYNWTALLD